MSRLNIYSSEGYRIDGRRYYEIRKLNITCNYIKLNSNNNNNSNKFDSNIYYGSS